MIERNWQQYLNKIEGILPKQSTETIHPWPNLIRDLLRQLDTTHKGLTVARKKEGVDTVLKRFAAKPEMLFDKLEALVLSWSATPTSGMIDISPLAPASVADDANTVAATTSRTLATRTPNENSEIINQLLELLTTSLKSILSAQPDLTIEIQSIIEQIREVTTLEQIASLTKTLRQLLIKFEIRGSEKTKAHEGLLRLLRLLVENVGDMVESEEWLHGQVLSLQEIIANPIDRNMIADAERSLRDTIINQGLLKRNLTDAKSTLKSLMTTFINRLNEITESTGDYHQKIDGYSKKIVQTHNLAELSHLLDDIMRDTRVIQASALRSHEELISTRQQAHQAEAEIKKLQQELAHVSELVREDQLTGTLNRRGLDAAFISEATRADRHQSMLCLALLDIDNFKHLNDTLGHQTGDQALIHLSAIIKSALRPSDTVARYGGEEFIILMPDSTLASAAATVERLQRDLTKKYFMHENDRVLVTFSAGVTQRAPQEAQEDVVGRADKAMYQAKKDGKNRVVIAQ